MKKKIKSKALLSLGVITTLATTGSVILSCGSSKSSDQQKLDGITTELIKEAITAFLSPSPTKDEPYEPTEFKLSINGLTDVEIKFKNWEIHDSIGSISFSIASIDKGTAHVDGAKFGIIIISGFATDQTVLDGITKNLVQDAIRAFLAPSSTTPIPNAPADNKFTVSISGLDGVDIHVSNWQKVSLGSVSFSITSIDKGVAHVDGAKFGTIQISNFQLATFIPIVTVGQIKISCTIQTKDGKYFVGTYHGLWVSNNDSRTSFMRIDQQYGMQSYFYICSILQTSNGDIFVGTNLNGVWVSIDGGATFTQVGGGLCKDLIVNSIYQTSDGHIYVGTSGDGLWVSSDNTGRVFTKVGGDLAMISAYIIYQTLDFIYVGTNVGLFESKNYGDSFIKVSDLFNKKIVLIYQTFDGYIYVGTSSRWGLFVSTDHGSSFSQKDILIPTIWYIHSIYQTSNQDIYVGTDGQGLWRSDNKIRSYRMVEGGLSCDMSVFSIYQPPNEAVLYVGTDNGLWAIT